MFDFFKNLYRYMKRCPVDPLVLSVQPSGKSAPHIIDACDRAGTEEVLLHKTNGILDRPFALRIRFVAYPEFQLLLCTEVLKDSGLYDFPVCFAGDEDRILINDEHRRTTTEFAETPVNGLTCFRGVILVILCVNASEP